MKLGLLTAPFPETPLMEVADWSAANGFESLEIACWPRATGADPALRRHQPHRRRQPVGAARPPRSSTRSTAKGLTISGLGYYPNPLHPDPAHRAEVIGHLKHVITAAEQMGVPLVNTFMGADGAKTQDANWEEALRSGRTSSPSPRTTAGRSPSRTARCSSQQRRVAGRPQPRHDAAHLAPDPRGVGRHDRAQLRPVAPDPPDDRHPAVHPRVRAARPPRPGQGPAHRPRGPVRARRLLDGHRLADPAPARASATSSGRDLFAALWRAGYDGDVIIEHEDRDFEKTDELIKRGFLLARDVLRPVHQVRP